MEGNHTQLEGQASHDKHQTEYQHLVLDLARKHGLEHLPDIQRTCGAIEHGQAVEQETAGHGTQHEILHGRFGRGRIVAAQGHQGVAGQRQQLQAQVNDQEVVAGDHDEHAQQGKHRQREHFAAAQHVAVCSVGA